MDDPLYTLDEAAKLTGLSIEALRKRFLRGQIEGIAAKAANDGKIRVRLTDGLTADLRRVAEQRAADQEEDSPEGGQEAAVAALTRLADSLEQRAIRAETLADQATAALTAERAARDTERSQWLAELEEARESRKRDRRAAQAAVERLKRQIASLQATAERARQPAQAGQPGFAARLKRLFS